MESNNSNNASNSSSVSQAVGTFGIPWYNIMTIVICSLGILTNVINILVLRSPRLNDKVFTCFLVSSINDIAYLSISMFSNIFSCGPLCFKYFFTYFGNIYSLYIQAYGCSVLKLFGILIEIYLSLQRYILLINKRFLVNLSLFKVLPSLFLFSVLVFIPTLTNFRIIQFDLSAHLYTYVLNEFGTSNFGKILRAASSWISIFLTLVVLTGLSIITAVKSRAYFFKKGLMKQNTGSLASHAKIGSFYCCNILDLIDIIIYLPSV